MIERKPQEPEMDPAKTVIDTYRYGQAGYESETARYGNWIMAPCLYEPPYCVDTCINIDRKVNNSSSRANQ
jgi:hypothetical protein